MTNQVFRVLLGLVATTLLATTASASLLVNGGFEDPGFAGAEQAGGGTGWSTFGSPFRVQQPDVPGNCNPISCAGAHGGTVALKVFGVAGVFQDFAASEGDQFAGSVWAINPDNADVMTGGQIGAVNIEWHGAGGFIDAAFGSTIDASTPIDVWTLLSVAGTAPAGTLFARFVIITGDFAGPGGGAPRFDDAEFNVVPVPGAVLLLGSGLMGLIGFGRRKRA